MLQRLQREVRTLLRDEYHPDPAQEPRWRHFASFWVLVFRSFARNQCSGWASALAYSSLLAFVPLLAVGIGIATSLLKAEDEQIKSWIHEVLLNVAPQIMRSEDVAETREDVINYVVNTIQNVQSGAVGVVGAIGFLTMILFLLIRIEETLNTIWGVSQGRTWYARLVNYWAAISLLPLLLVAAILSSTSLHFGDTTWIQNLPLVGQFLVKLIPLPILTAACALFYAFMPKARVHWQAALVGGLVAGILWILNVELSALFVAQIARNQTVYKSLAAVPAALAALYFFWLLLLFGAQVTYCFQNRKTYRAAKEVERVHQEGREFVALRVMIEVGLAFATGSPPPTTDVLAERLEVPGELISRTTSVLLRTRLLAEVTIDEEDGAFLPARPLDAIRVSDIIQAMRRGIGGRLPTRADPSRAAAEETLSRIALAEQQAGARTLADLVADRLNAERQAEAADPREPDRQPQAA
jgi:membrane protein